MKKIDESKLKKEVASGVHRTSDFMISIPPTPDGKEFPLVVLFVGLTGIEVIWNQTPNNYFQKAILAFSCPGGQFSQIQSELEKLLEENYTTTTYKEISICGYSAGGRDAIKKSRDEPSELCGRWWL